jgi:hypothetical protein
MATYIPRFSVKCSFIRFIPNMQCWNILIQIYSSKQTEPKHTKPRFAVICPLGVSTKKITSAQDSEQKILMYFLKNKSA